MLLKHRGNGHVARGHGELVLGDGDRAVLYLPLLEVVALGGLSRQGHFRARGSIGDVGSSRAALGGIVHRDGVGGLREGDLQLIQLRRFGVRAGELQSAFSGLGDHQVKGDGMGLRCSVRGTSCHRTCLDVFTTPGQSVVARATAVERLHRVDARHRSVVVENNGISRIEAVDKFAVAGPIILNHSDWPLFAGAHHVVQFTKLRLQGGSLTLAREDKGICFGVLRPRHQVSLGSFNGLLGIGKGFGGRILLCQYLFGIGNGLSIGIPAALIPLRMLGLGLVHQSQDICLRHFSGGHICTGGADLPQAGPWPSGFSRLQIYSHMLSGLTHRICHTISV